MVAKDYESGVNKQIRRKLKMDHVHEKKLVVNFERSTARLIPQKEEGEYEFKKLCV